MQRGLVGSEMCIRDSFYPVLFLSFAFFSHCFILWLSPPLFIFSLFIFFLIFFFFSVSFLFRFFPTLPHVLCVDTFSYTHLTLPTILLVQISVGAVSLKKKNQKKTKRKNKKRVNTQTRTHANKNMTSQV
eukprot:TRINITY_DN14492_c0_g1_i1.p2 TRINITY_DN14492_c0_g1~~TRINITY_DN14492_c0_g1_i1.p2  ORF type:complete len:130 (-),score=34.06 TRINITY_DN14492_c0_g1_i1:1-390(-)